MTRSRNTSPDDPVTNWARAIVAGEIIAGPHIRNACQRHIADLEFGSERGLKWDLGAALRVIKFFPEILRLAGGQFEGLPFELQPSQQFIVGSLFGWKRRDGKRRFRRAYVEQAKGQGKALAIDTPIPTPIGWTAMGELQIGDQVFDETGAIRNVIGAYDVMHGHSCYRLTFSDGCEIIADAEHLWLTHARRTGLKKGPKPGRPGRVNIGIRTTEQIARTVRVRESTSLHPQAKWNHRIEVAGPLATPTAELPISPYVLGCWLGDGESDNARITVGHADLQIAKEIHAEEGIRIAAGDRGANPARILIGHGDRTQRSRDLSIRARLRSLGVLGNKHIPQIYLRASHQQRAALLQGLMDTDGYIASTGQCDFAICNRRLAEDTLELVRSLGLKATIRTRPAKLYGRIVGESYRMVFEPNFPVFRLDRKRARMKPPPRTRRLSAGRMIVGCDPVASVPVRCIAVDSPSRLFLAGRGMIPTHNTPLAAGIGHYCLIADGESRAEIYAAAANSAQAMVLFRDAVAMREQSPALSKILTPSGGNPVWNLSDLRTGSFFRPISSEVRRSGSGPRPHCALCDEVHEHPDGLTIEMLERGFKWREQPLLFMTTNSGSDRNSACWNEHEHAVRVAAGTPSPDDTATFIGEVIDDETFSFVCGLDPDDDPLEDPTCWVKANPLLGITIQPDYLASVVRQAKQIPGKLNGILRLHFCQWTEADVAWISRAALEDVLSDFDPSEHSGNAVFAGADLSATRDLTALAFVVPTGWIEVEREGVKTRQPTFDAWVESWTPADTIQQRQLEDKVPYEFWVERGYLNAAPGKLVRMDYVAARVAEMQLEYQLEAVAYDAYAFRKNFEPELDQLGVTVRLIEHPQGGKRKAAESQLWMPGSVKELESLILERRIRIRRNPLVVLACMSAALESDPFDNRWFSKRRATNRIDPLVALAMAIGAATSGVARPVDVSAMIG